MQVVITSDAVAAGEYIADVIEHRARSGSLQVIGVATGSSPLPVYQALTTRNIPALRSATVFALDEYVGLSPQHPQSYHSVVAREVTQPLGLNPDRVHVPDGSFDGAPTAGLRYEQLISEAGGVDLQIVGIGASGHIGFNEPSSSLSSRTRMKTLTAQTRQDNARFFDTAEDVPLHCITQGLGTISQAREVMLIATGAHKAAAIAAAVEGPLTSMCPASVLQMHQKATVVIDHDAAADLRLREYYEYVFANRPDWQI